LTEQSSSRHVDGLSTGILLFFLLLLTGVIRLAVDLRFLLAPSLLRRCNESRGLDVVFVLD